MPTIDLLIPCGSQTCLLRTLVNNPRLRSMVKHLVCAINLCEVNGQCPDPELNKSYKHDYWPIRTSSQQVACKAKLSQLDIDDFARDVLLHSRLMDGTPETSLTVCSDLRGEAIFGAILCLVPNLHTLRLHCPHQSELTQFELLTETRYTELDKIIGAAFTNPKINHSPPLRQLRTLDLLPALENLSHKPIPTGN